MQTKRSVPGHLDVKHLLLLFALEGALLQFTNSINGFANNLFATNLGATDSQIGLIQTVPNLVAMSLMLPIGILSDRARSSRTVPLAMLIVMAAGYILMGLVPAFGSSQIAMFFVALMFTVGGLVSYNTQWQSFFGDVVDPGIRNQSLTQRNRYMFIVGIAAPILCGVLMGRSADAAGKILVLQWFYFLCAAVTGLQILVIAHIQAPLRSPSQRNSFSLRDVGQTIVLLARSHAFRWFFIPVLFFYMTWQMDWSMWYIGQVQYLHMTETELSIASGVFNVGQLAAIGVLSGLVKKRGNDYVLPFAGLGLMMCPVLMVISTLLPQAIRATSFTVMLTVFNAPQCAINLCVVQMLLRVVPEKNRGLSVSLFTLATTLTNSFMPYLGVQLYTLLGADYRALLLFNATVLALRLVALLLLAGRYRLLRRRGELEEPLIS